MKIGFKAKNFTIDQHRFLNHRWYQEYQQNFGMVNFGLE